MSNDAKQATEHKSCDTCAHIYNGYWCVIKHGPKHLIKVCSNWHRAWDTDWSSGCDMCGEVDGT